MQIQATPEKGERQKSRRNSLNRRILIERRGRLGWLACPTAVRPCLIYVHIRVFLVVVSPGNRVVSGARFAFKSPLQLDIQHALIQAHTCMHDASSNELKKSQKKVRQGRGRFPRPAQLSVRPSAAMGLKF
ncbi:unnamed protein product [Bursaphelenchus xylophilus]|uniref:(pine wood nematode) hypothetical protein n=1 Tax=Bursaphelenchus xylophilus TaxID=6326 RepID=A0A1I7RRJ6_BURXY|nr:unnamed protein product [Bursaphelenchus xylophilus]CAG9131079.1 unnamed protein product [Bursaphelenchus xylophilus]